MSKELDKGSGKSSIAHALPEEDKQAIQERMLELYAQRVRKQDIYAQVRQEYPEVGQTALDYWLKDAIRKQDLPDPAFALRRDLLLVDAAIAALIPGVLKGQASAHVALERWMNRRAKYLGLDAPDKLEAIIRNVHTGPIDEEIRELSERLGLNVPPAVEAPIDAEVEE